MILTSFITHTIDLDSPNLIISRMTISDVFGLLAIVLFFVIRTIEKSWGDKIPRVYIMAVGVVSCVALSFFTSLSPKSTVFEVLILCYLVLISYVVFEVLKSEIDMFIMALVSASLLAFSIGLYDLFASNNNWHTVFPNVDKAHGGSTFRYFGQAANYSFTMLTILIPLKYSDFTNHYSLLKKNSMNTTIVLGVLLLFSTGRVSIILSFLIAVGLFVAYTRKVKIIKDLSYMLVIFIGFISMGIYTIPNLISHVIRRFEQRITHRVSGTDQADFIITNFKNTFRSFFDNPLFGSGLGGFVNRYSVFEIHGTYLKMIGETGLVGLIGYLLFIITFVKMCIKSKTSFFYLFLPFLFASLVSWGYNYHLRKKEFWILFSFLAILQFLYKKKAKLKHN
jgi:hypothetical protein